MLTIEDMDVFYGKVKALHGISFHVPPKGITALLGANGAGKTTTLRTICGILKPAGGTIIFEDQRIDGMGTEAIVRRGISIVPEGRRLFPQMTVLENLELGSFTRKDKVGVERDLKQIFDYFPRLRERKSQLAVSLSGGEQQMLAIGRALMVRPKLLLLDEPSMGLAPLAIKEIYQIVEAMNREGMAILLVEQNAKKALQVAHEACVLETGKITMKGDPKSLLASKQFYEAYLGKGSNKDEAS